VRFWDSSAVVPLVVRQPVSSDADEWLEEDGTLVVWTLTLVEVVSALRRLARDGALPERAVRQAESIAVDLVGGAHVVTDVERVKQVACRLLRIHALRGADACQLAAALAWADGHPEDLVLHTFDRRLGEAAEREGFRVIPTL
jgi:hypothetical protein